jgi:hypothetical protein
MNDYTEKIMIELSEEAVNRREVEWELDEILNR